MSTIQNSFVQYLTGKCLFVVNIFAVGNYDLPWENPKDDGRQNSLLSIEREKTGDRRGRKEITMMRLNIKAGLVLIPWNPIN